MKVYAFVLLLVYLSTLCNFVLLFICNVWYTCPDVGESTKLVSEYKAKLQISEAENAKLEGTVSI